MKNTGKSICQESLRSQQHTYLMTENIVICTQILSLSSYGDNPEQDVII